MPRTQTPEPLSAAVGARIRQLRLELGLTLEKLAYETDQSKGHLSDVERGHSRPSLATLAKIAERLGVDLVDLVNVGSNLRQQLIDASRNTSDDTLRKAIAALSSR